MTAKTVTKGLKSFLIIWVGQSISLVGSGLTGFALGVWVFQRTGSVTQFALISLFTTLPGIVFSPMAGALVDRWDRRMAMILSDSGAGLCTLTIALLIFSRQIQIWHIYLVMAISSTFSAFRWPAYTAATTLLLPQEQFGRGGGMLQLTEAIAQIGAPVIAGALVGVIQIYGVILIDFTSFLIALVTLFVVRFPRPAATAEGKAGQGSLLREAGYGWTYIRARPGLFGLLLFFATTNFATGIVQVLFTPLVLSFSTPDVLGRILSIGGLGFLIGSLAMSAWGGPRPRIYGILGLSLLQAFVLLAAGLPPSPVVLTVAVFFFFFSIPIVNGCSQAIWQSKTAPDVQGRVFAVRRMIAWSTLPLAYLIAGPLADQVFEPLLMEEGLLAHSVGQVIGVGAGRGIGLLFIGLGLFCLLATATVFAYPRLRHVERELPDALPVPAPAAG